MTPDMLHIFLCWQDIYVAETKVEVEGYEVYCKSDAVFHKFFSSEICCRILDLKG